MAKNDKRPKGWLVGKQQVDDWLALATEQMKSGEYEGVLRTSKRILQMIPKNNESAADALGLMGMVYAMQKDFEKSYQAMSQAIQADATQSHLFYNRGLSALFTSRTGRALGDFEKAVELEGTGKMSKQYREQVTFCRKIVDGELALRGAGFSLEKLIEQQDFFWLGNEYSRQGKWQEAEECFRKSIEMGDCLPQPQGNLGVCLLMQKRFDEAEAVFRKALEIDPKYERAHEHLEKLVGWRENPDEKPEYLVTSPYEDVKASITFVE